MRAAALAETLTMTREALALTPGMQVDVDLLIGHRSILSYLTERLSRARQTAFTER